MKNEYKKMIPNILTIFRIIVTPIIIVLCAFKKIDDAIIFVLVGAITDFLDGYLARKWNVVSLKGAKLDAVADKVFAIGIVSALAFRFNTLWILVILEVIISSINLYLHFKTNKTNSLIVGKIKTWSLFITIALAFFTYYFNKIGFLFSGFIYMTINLQLLSIISYIYDYFSDLKEDKKITTMEKTIVVDNINDIIYNYEDDN